MKLGETILFSLAIVFFIIGVHQTFLVGIIESYWLFMLTVTMLLLYKIKKGKQPPINPKSTATKQPGPKLQKRQVPNKAKTRK